MDNATETALGTLAQFDRWGIAAFKKSCADLQACCDIQMDVAALGGVTEINLANQAWFPLLTACEVAGNVSVLFGETRMDVRPMPLAVLMRTVLLGTAKCVYVLGPDDPDERQLRLLRVANVDLKDAIRGLNAATALNAGDAGTDHAPHLASREVAQRQVAAELAKRGQKEGSSIGETDLLKEAAKTVTLRNPTETNISDLAMMLWNDMSGATHARAWHREAFHDTYTAGYRTLQLLIPAHAFLDAAWRLWHQRRGASGGPYDC